MLKSILNENNSMTIVISHSRLFKFNSSTSWKLFIFAVEQESNGGSFRIKSMWVTDVGDSHQNSVVTNITVTQSTRVRWNLKSNFQWDIDPNVVLSNDLESFHRNENIEIGVLHLFQFPKYPFWSTQLMMDQTGQLTDLQVRWVLRLVSIFSR